MDIVDICDRFPTREDCLIYLEFVRWNGKPKCPYCESTHFTRLKKERRYHCNRCYTTYSVTVRTMFHKTHVDLQKWFLAIWIMLHTRTNISVRQLANYIKVNRNTAWRMSKRIRIAIIKERKFLEKLIEFQQSEN